MDRISTALTIKTKMKDLEVVESFKYPCTVEPPNRGHLGEMVFVLISEVVLISEAKPYHAKFFMQHLLCKCLLLQKQSKQSLFQYTSIISSIQSNNNNYNYN